jgi:oligopeptidase A
MSHPFLEDHFHIRWSTLTPEHVAGDITAALELAGENLAELFSQEPDTLTYENTFGALEDATDLLDHSWGRLNHLDSVNDNPEQRAALNAMLPAVSEFYASIPLNPRLWSVLKAFADSPAAQLLGPVHQRYVEETVLDFQQAGADLAVEKKERVAAIQAELSQVTKQYSENVLDSTNAWEMVIEDPALLAGLPASARAAALADAVAKGIASEEEPKWRFTLQFPSTGPVMQHLDDSGVRRQVWEASTQVGAAGAYDNTELVWRILELRREKAEILGHDDFAALTLQRRMARSGQAAMEFVEGLHRRISPAFQRECQELADYKAAQTNTPSEPLEPWDFSYWAEKRRQEQYAFDSEELRPFFPVDRVMDGMFTIASRLFGVTITQRQAAYFAPGTRPAEDLTTIEVWHPQCTFYDLHDQVGGEHLGSFYADWHPRESKRGGAWMNSLKTGRRDHQAREPHLGLIIGNMSPPTGDKPALLNHREVETIFHEFGHLLHHLLGEVEVRALSGTNVAWDFVELPSQIMENFCWDRESLDLFARHHETGATIPDELFEKMIAAKNYMSASAFMRQLAFGKLDLELHLRPGHYLGRDLDEVDREILAGYKAPTRTEGPSMTRRFNHLFSSPTGYAAGYYSYKWAEVLDADAFTRFQTEGVLNPDTGLAFREHILSKGNSAAPDELFRRFMGRDPELSPLLARAGLGG